VKRISREQAKEYEIVRKDPLLRVSVGEEFVIETEDADNGTIRTEYDLPESAVGSETVHYNPLGGPVFVEGAEKGDVLVVNILDVVPEQQGHTLILRDGHPLQDSARWSECRGPYTHIIKHLPGSSGTMSDGKAVFDKQVVWGLHPLIGTIGVAPERGVESGADSNLGQGPWGGNLDCRDICKGSKLYLPVYHEGGLLYAGDVHGTQGDTEFTGVANEARAEVFLSCEIIKDKTIPFVRIEKEDSIVQLNCYRPLEDAITQAFLWLMDWLVTDYEMKPRDAYMIMSVNPYVRVSVYQMVKLGRLEYTVGVQFPKEHLSRKKQL